MIENNSERSSSATNNNTSPNNNVTGVPVFPVDSKVNVVKLINEIDSHYNNDDDDIKCNDKTDACNNIDCNDTSNNCKSLQRNY